MTIRRSPQESGKSFFSSIVIPATRRPFFRPLLVIILLELFRTVLGFLQSERVRLEPFLHVGVIASVRKILTTGAELSHIKDVPKETFDHYMMDMGLHVVVILVLMIALYLVKKSEATTPSTVTL